MSYEDEVLADTPVGYWRLNEVQDPYPSTVADASGNGHTGDVLDTTVEFEVAGVAGSTAADFPNLNDGNCISVPHHADLHITDATGLSIEFWYRSTVDDTSAVMGKYSFSAGDSLFDVMARTGGKFRIAFRGTTTSDTGDILGGLADSEWHHIVATHSGSVRRVWVDGTLEHDVSSTWVADASSTIDLLIGNRVLAASGNLGTIGQLDEVAIYAGVLSQARVEAHYAAAPTVDPADFAVVVTGSTAALSWTASL